MTTPFSSSVPFAVALDMTDRFDVRTLGELLSDDPNNPLSPSQVTSSTKLVALLSEASGMVESASLIGNVYSPDDLSALTGNSKAMLAGIVARIGMFLLWERRPKRMAKMELPASAQMAMELLDQIAGGLRAFGIKEVIDAYTAPAPQFMTPAEVHTRASISDHARRFFGDRGQYNVPGR